jgi:hypothetical protein
MIYFSRTASIAPGRTDDALAFARVISKYINENYETTLEVLMPIGGNPNRITWRAHYDSLAQWEAATSRLMADKVYVELVAKQSNTFVPGSVHDDLWRTV